jgi:predicted dehydrogenase
VEITPQCAQFSWTDSLAAEVAHFVDCIRHDRQPMCPGEDGAVAVRVLDALYRSARSGREVRLR